MKIKCFLDTTYLMPLFGFGTSIQDLDAQFREGLVSNRFLFLFSPVSIIEIKWQVIKLSRKNANTDAVEHRFSRTLSSLKDDARFSPVNFLDANINDISFELRKLGHSDYFDIIIASSALWEASIFVTEDDPLKYITQTYLAQKNAIAEPHEIEISNWNSFYTNYISF